MQLPEVEASLLVEAQPSRRPLLSQTCLHLVDSVVQARSAAALTLRVPHTTHQVSFIACRIGLQHLLNDRKCHVMNSVLDFFCFPGKATSSGLSRGPLLGSAVVGKLRVLSTPARSKHVNFAAMSIPDPLKRP